MRRSFTCGARSKQRHRRRVNIDADMLAYAYFVYALCARAERADERARLRRKPALIFPPSAFLFLLLFDAHARKRCQARLSYILPACRLSIIDARCHRRPPVISLIHHFIFICPPPRLTLAMMHLTLYSSEAFCDMP